MSDQGTVQVEAQQPRPEPVMSRRFRDLDDLGAILRHADAEFVPLGPSREVQARYLAVDLGDGASLQLGAMTLSHLTRGRVHSDRLQVSFPLQVVGSLCWNGRPVDDRTAAFLRPDAEVQAAATGTEEWAMLSLPRARFERTLAGCVGAEFLPFTESCRLVGLGDALRGAIQGTFSRVTAAVEQEAGSLAAPEARRALGETLLGLAGRALESLPRRTPDRERTVQGHSRLVAVAEEFMRQRLALPLYVGDLCQATGVSERTLRSAFRNVYGVGPNRVLKLRRLVQVRRALQHGHGQTRVSEVATQNGFWDLGRFAGDYRRLFGESPSQTLRRSETAQA